MEQIERAALGVGIEVDQHVGADDDIEVLHRPHSEGVRKIQFLESDHLSDGVAQYVAIILQLEVALYRALRQRPNRVRRIDRAFGGIQDIGVDIRTDDLERRLRTQRLYLLAYHDRDRIGFIPR